MNASEREFCRAAVHEGFYLETYPDVRTSGLDARTHFAERGVHEGRVPSPLFRDDWYRSANKLDDGRFLGEAQKQLDWVSKFAVIHDAGAEGVDVGA